MGNEGEGRKEISNDILILYSRKSTFFIHLFIFVLTHFQIYGNVQDFSFVSKHWASLTHHHIFLMYNLYFSYFTIKK